MKTGQVENAVIQWRKMTGRACDFKNPHTPSPHKERGMIQGTNGLEGDQEQVVITDSVGNKVFIPVNMAGIMIELLQE